MARPPVWPIVSTSGISFPRWKLLHTLFGGWAARQLAREHWDVTYSFSGVSEEWLNRRNAQGAVRLLVRGSAHIRAQQQLLVDEQKRTGVLQDQPSAWRVEREEREYRKADAVIVLSSFAHQTFLEQRFPSDRVRLMVSGVRVESFRPPQEVIQERVARLKTGQPLRLLNIGTMSFLRASSVGSCRNGAFARSVCFQIRCIRAVLPEAKALVADLSSRIEFIPRLPQEQLASQYAWGDLFVFPTIEDGFPTVCAQASAAGLPVLTTPNGVGTHLVTPDQTGWVLPIRMPPPFCNASVPAIRIAQHWPNGERVYDKFRPRDWNCVADDFLGICANLRKPQAARDPAAT